MAQSPEPEYQARVAYEIRHFQDNVEVHDASLPEIFHYWSHNKIRPKFEAFGFSSPHGMFKKFLEEACARKPEGPWRFVSIGAGNCDFEISVAEHLRSKGYSDFIIDCLDINPTMLERGKLEASQKGVASQIHGLEAD